MNEGYSKRLFYHLLILLGAFCVRAYSGANGSLMSLSMEALTQTKVKSAYGPAPRASLSHLRETALSQVSD